MTSQDFRAALARLRLTQTEFSQRLQELGDDRPWPTILRTVQELARPGRTARTPWSVVALMGAIERLSER